MSQATQTTNHDEIRRWVEARNGHPSVVASTRDKSGEGLLRIDFDKPEANLEEIGWDAFFETFEDRNLAFLHQDKTADGSTSRFFKFVSRH